MSDLLQAEGTVAYSALATALLAGSAWLSTRRAGEPRALAEAVVEVMEDAIAAVVPEHARRLLPFIGSLWLFLLVANLMGVVPGLHSPTRDPSCTAALAVLVFLAVHYYGVRIHGVRAYLRHYLRPSPILLPFHLVGEITRTLALAIRLFGNMMSLELTAVLVLMVAGFLAPIPILLLHLVEALVQAYLFGMLALVYIAGGLQAQGKE